MSKKRKELDELMHESEDPRQYMSPDELAYYDKPDHLACSLVNQPEHCHSRRVKELLKSYAHNRTNLQ